MRTGCRILILSALLFSLLPGAQAEPSIFMPAMVPTPVRHAAHRLPEYTGMPIDNKGTKPVTLQWPKIDEKK